MASCMAIDPQIVATMPIAFKGTVNGVDGDVVTMTVDEWYQGGDAAAVTLAAPQGLEALIGGIEFDAGGQYLITAAEGSVNYCGFSGPVSSELQAVYDEAFPG